MKISSVTALGLTPSILSKRSLPFTYANAPYGLHLRATKGFPNIGTPEFSMLDACLNQYYPSAYSHTVNNSS